MHHQRNFQTASITSSFLFFYVVIDCLCAQYTCVSVIKGLEIPESRRAEAAGRQVCATTDSSFTIIFWSASQTNLQSCGETFQFNSHQLSTLLTTILHRSLSTGSDPFITRSGSIGSVYPVRVLAIVQSGSDRYIFYRFRICCTLVTQRIGALVAKTKVPGSIPLDQYRTQY